MVVGSGLREGELRSCVRELGNEESFLWMGWRRDLPDLYPAMDALALTSFDEGTPVAVLEALATGTPVAARAVGGVSEVLRGVLLARLIPAATAEAVAETLEEVLALGLDEDEVRRVRNQTVERFSVPRLAGDVRLLYRRELARVGLA